MGDDIEVIDAAAELFAARLWDAVSELMETPTEGKPNLCTPTTRWEGMSRGMQERFIALMVDKQFVAPLVSVVGYLARLERGERN